MSFEKDLKKIDQRSWGVIKSKWMEYLPSFSYPGEPPQLELLDFYGLDEIAKTTSLTPGELRTEVPNLRSEVFREGIYLFHKASHVCRSGQMQLENNMVSWSISSAYHSSFFALKSLLCLLGLSFPRMKFNGKCLMVDCFPKEEELSSNQRKKGIQPRKELKFVTFPSLSHHQFWEILHRILNATDVNIWNEEMTNYLLKFEPTDYAFQRNSLHYKNNYWIIPDDLFNSNSIMEFGDFSEAKDYFSSINQSTSDFSFFLSYIMMKMTYDLIKDIAVDSPILTDEFNLINDCIKTPSAERMIKSFPFLT